MSRIMINKKIVLTVVFVLLFTTVLPLSLLDSFYNSYANAEVNEASIPDHVISIDFIENINLIEGTPNVVEGGIIGTLFTEGAQEPITYALVEGDSTDDVHNNQFDISGADVLVAPGVKLIAGIHFFRVEAIDAEGNLLQQGFSVKVEEAVGDTQETEEGTTEKGTDEAKKTEKNSVIKDINFIELAELQEGTDNLVEGGILGILINEGGQGPVTFRLVNGDSNTNADNSKFDIDDNIVIVAEGVILTEGIYTFIVEATDALGSTIIQTFNITVMGETEEPIQLNMMSQGNTHQSNPNVYLWNNGQENVNFVGSKSSDNSGSFSKNQQYLEMFARPDSGYLSGHKTVTTQYSTTANLTGVSGVGISWRNTGSNSNENKSWLDVGSLRVERSNTFGSPNLVNQLMNVSSLSGNQNIVITARGRYEWALFGGDDYNSRLRVYQLWLVMEQHSINVSSTSGGSIQGLGGTYNYGENVSLNAQPAAGYEFEKWTVNGVNHSTNRATTVFVNGSKNVQAHFKPKMITVTTEIVGPEGSGTVSGGNQYPFGTQVTLNAIANEGYGFERWSSTVTGYDSEDSSWSFFVPPNDITVTAYFDRSYNIETNTNIIEGGTVSGDGKYLENRLVTLQAMANETNGYEFVNWTENGQEVWTEALYAFDAVEDRDLVANFRLRTESVTMTASPSWAGAVSGEGAYEYGSMVNATAVPRDDYMFVNWTENGEILSTNPFYGFQVISSPNLVANFMLKPGTFSAQPFSQFVGENISFDASMVFSIGGESYSYHWDFGDGTLSSGIKVNHTYSEAGDYDVVLRVLNNHGIEVVERRRIVKICEMLPLHQSEFKASPQGIAWVKPGATIAWEVYFANNGVPLSNRQIEVFDEVLNVNTTITTDKNGKANYQVTVPNGHQEFSLKMISFTHETLKITRGVQIFDNNIRLTGRAFDHYTGKPLVGVTIAAGGKIAKTDSQGNYVINGLTSGRETISVMMENYQTQNREISLNGLSVVQNFSLQRHIPGANPVIGRVYSELTDSNARKDFFSSPGQERNLTFKVEMDWRGHAPGVLVFVTPQGEYSVDFGVGEKTFNLGDFNPGDRMEIKAITEHGTQSNIVDAGFEITQPLPIASNTTNFTLPSADTGPIGANLPFIGGSSMGLDLGNVPVEVDFDEENGEIVVSVGWKIYDKSSGPDESNVEKMKSLWNQMKKNKGMGKSLTSQKMASADVIVGGKIVFTYDSKNKTWPLREGYITVLAEGEVSYTVYYLTPVAIPLYGQVKAGASLSAELGLAWNSEEEEIELVGMVSPEVYVRLAIGAGIADTLSVEGWGKALGHMDISFLPEVEVVDKYVELSMGYKVVLLVFSYEETLWNRRWPEAGMKMFMSMPEVGQLTPMSRDYLNEESEWMPVIFSTFSQLTGEGANREETTMQSNIFPYAEAKLTLTDGGKMMVWVTDDSTRSALNRTSLVYSIHDGENWSEPMYISDDGTADFNPEIARMTDGAIATWVNNSSVLDDSTSVADYLTAGEIAVAFYDGKTNTWVGIQNLTDDNVRDGAPKVAASDNTAMVVWTKNAAEDYPDDGPLNNVLYGQPDDIIFSVWNGEEWSQPEVAVPKVGSVVSSSLTFDGTKAVYAYILDSDADLETKNDQELYIVTYGIEEGWGSPVQITNNSVQDANPQIVIDNDEVMLFWYQDGKILYINSLDDTEPRIIVEGENTSSMADFSLAIGYEGAIAVLWPEGEGGAQEIYASVYDPINDSWSNKVKLTENGGINRSIDATLDEEGNIIAVYGKRSVIIDEESQQIILDKTDLTYSKLTVGKDISVDANDITFSEENPIPGSTVTIRAMINNKGELAEKEIEVAFYDGNPANRGTQIGETQVITGVLNAGDSVEVSVEWNIPPSFASREIYIVVDPEYKILDRDRNNNIASVGIIQPDLQVTKIDWQPMGTEDYLITARVANRGYVTAADATVKLLQGSFGGTQLEVRNIGNLEPGQEVEESFIWRFNEGDFPEGIANLTVLIESSNERFTTGNNIRTIIIRQPRAFAGGAITALDLNKDNISLSLGSEETLVEIFTPLDATNRNVSWSTSDATVAIVDDGVVTALGIGTAEITVISYDGEFTATAIVEVLPPPVIELMGPEEIQLNMGETYQEQGATATENTHGDLNTQIQIGGDTVNTSIAGVYTITYNVTGSGGNAAEQINRRVTVAPPAPSAIGSMGGIRTINITGLIPMATLRLKDSQHNVLRAVTLAGDTEYTLTSVVTGEGYYLTQTINGIESQLSNSIDVGPDITPPELTLIGDDTIHLLMGDHYVDAGAEAEDELDGNITYRITVTGLPNTSVPGIYVIRYNISDFAGNAAQEVNRTVIVAPTPVTATGGYNTVLVTGGIPGGTLTLYDNIDRVRGTATVNANGEYTFTGVSGRNGYYVVQTVNDADSESSNLVDVINRPVSFSPQSFIASKVRTADDQMINTNLTNSDEAVINIENRTKQETELSVGVIEGISQNDRDLIVVGKGVVLEFAPHALLTKEVRQALEEGNGNLVIGVSEIPITEASEIMEKVLLGDTSGFFQIGSNIYDLSVHLKTESGTEEIKNFQAPITVTIDLSHLGELSKEEIEELTGVRFAENNSGDITPVKLGGSYDQKTKTFTFYTTEFSLYTVMRVENYINIQLRIDHAVTQINGSEKTLDVPPIIIDGRTMVPLRFISEGFGAEVDWINETSTVIIKLDGKEIRLVIGELAPGLDVPPIMMNNRTLVPLRYISEEFGADVKWFPESQSIEITK